MTGMTTIYVGDGGVDEWALFGKAVIESNREMMMTRVSYWFMT